MKSDNALHTFFALCGSSPALLANLIVNMDSGKRSFEESEEEERDLFSFLQGVAPL